MTKGELPGADAVRDSLQAELQRDVLLISAVTGQGLDRLTRRILATLDATTETPAPQDAATAERPS